MSESSSKPLSDAMIRYLRLCGRYANYSYFRLRDLAADGNGNVIDRRWESLIILDACRYDLFASVSKLDGLLKIRDTKASNTVEFLEKNVAGRTLHDTVYVTANPQFRKYESKLNAEFHDVIDLWDHSWNEEIRTVLPEVVTGYAIEAATKYPHKRLLIHYNQPHTPIIGDEGRKNFDLDAISEHPLPFWKQPLAGEWDIDDDLIWRAYEENLKLTLPQVKTLLSELDGRTVVTADHGNMIGDRGYPIPIKEYGHPKGIYYPKLVTVPWFVHDDGSEREIRADPPENSSRKVGNQIESRLEDLGYV